MCGSGWSAPGPAPQSRARALVRARVRVRVRARSRAVLLLGPEDIDTAARKPVDFRAAPGV
ncbi:hypothetical protein SSP531S_30800 [Streptomyces spongiicola]|uniref:Uncharacterized protein n=1 Tax=Streptomyces spongiicola TaxID=1690221 RepID=A0A388T0W3_9ACTN|nr:hypothetical protein SSP531S_30800 [Streptomyces spongiicola]